MAVYINTSYTQEDIEAFEALCQTQGREVPALAVLLEYESAKAAQGETRIVFYNAFGGSLVAGQTIDDLNDVNQALGFDMEARFYIIPRELLTQFQGH